MLFSINFKNIYYFIEITGKFIINKFEEIFRIKLDAL